jgi:hypothetical protein
MVSDVILEITTTAMLEHFMELGKACQQLVSFKEWKCNAYAHILIRRTPKFSSREWLQRSSATIASVSMQYP